MMQQMDASYCRIVAGGCQPLLSCSCRGTVAEVGVDVGAAMRPPHAPLQVRLAMTS